MVRYFMHLRDGTEELLDPEGKEFASLADLRDAVLVTVRDLMVGDVRDGVLDLRFRIDAQDQAGTIVHTMPFRYAVNIIPEGSIAPDLKVV